MIKKSQDLTLKDKLSRLTYLQACKLLGDNGQQILQQGEQLGSISRCRCGSARNASNCACWMKQTGW